MTRAERPGDPWRRNGRRARLESRTSAANDYQRRAALDATQRRSPTPHLQDLTSFVGTDSELSQMRDLLSRTRLLTLTGVGGVGKTRLASRFAYHVQTEFRDRVVLVELGAVTDSTNLAGLIAVQVGCDQTPGRDAISLLIDALKDLPLLLLMDNCEHLIGECANVVEVLLRSCSHLVVLATSREPLGVPGEATMRVPPLAVPGRAIPRTAAGIDQYEAVRLFVDRARSALPTFALSNDNAAGVASVCGLLDGIPLAIELAAPGLRVLTIDQLAERLEAALQSLSRSNRNAPFRQQTMRATLEWSYQLLTRAERKLFDRVAVFVGGWSLEAAESLESNDLPKSDILGLLAGLVDKSLAVAETVFGSMQRYRLLEPVRQYAQEHLASSVDAPGAGAKHANYFLLLGEAAELHLIGGGESETWLKRLVADRGNLRAALHWFAAHSDVDNGLRLGGSLWRFWYLRGSVAECLEWLVLIRRLAESATPGASLAKALNGAGALAFQQNEFALAQTLLHQSLQIWQQLGDSTRIAACLNNLGAVALERGDYPEACRLYEKALQLHEGLERDRPRLALALNNFAWVRAEHGEYETAHALSVRSVEVSYALGDARGVAHHSLAVAWCLLQTGYARQARDLLRRTLRYFSANNAPDDIPVCLEDLGAVAAKTGHQQRAIRLAGAAARVRGTLGQPRPSPIQLRRLASWLDPLRRTVGPRLFASAWGEGDGLSLNDAVAYACADDGVSVNSIADGVGSDITQRSSPLTPREEEVARLLAQGRTNRDIATQLNIATSTAERHVANILRKLGFSSRAEIAVWKVQRAIMSTDK